MFFVVYSKEREAELRIEDLTSDLAIKQKRIDHCQHELTDLQVENERYRHEVVQRDQDIRRICNETQQEIKYDYEQHDMC
jgi:uncharacterized protein (DUF3084 family)